MAQNKDKIGAGDIKPGKKVEKKMSLMARKMKHVKNFENLRTVKSADRFN